MKVTTHEYIKILNSVIKLINISTFITRDDQREIYKSQFSFDNLEKCGTSCVEHWQHSGPEFKGTWCSACKIKWTLKPIITDVNSWKSHSTDKYTLNKCMR